VTTFAHNPEGTVRIQSKGMVRAVDKLDAKREASLTRMLV
jgi:hypothetical protein